MFLISAPKIGFPRTETQILKLLLNRLEEIKYSSRSRPSTDMCTRKTATPKPVHKDVK